MPKIELVKIEKQSIPEFQQKFWDKQSQVALRINRLLKQKGWKRKDLAEKMQVKESSLSRMLGTIGSNLGLETISKMEVALEDNLLLTPEEAEYKIILDLERASKLYELASQRALKRPIPTKISLSIDPSNWLKIEELTKKFPGIESTGAIETEEINFQQKPSKDKWPKSRAKN